MEKKKIIEFKEIINILRKINIFVTNIILIFLVLYIQNFSTHILNNTNKKIYYYLK